MAGQERRAGDPHYGLGGAIVGAAAAGLYTRSLAGAVLGAFAGALTGTAIGTVLVYRAALHGTRELRVVTLELS